MIKVRSNSPVITTNKVQECVELLGDEYMSLNYLIDVYKEQGRLEYERLKKPDMSEQAYEQILNGRTYKPPGICLSEKKTIKIFPFNFSDEQYPNFRLVFFLYHELRHAWQNEHGMFLDEEEIESIDDNIDEYKKSPAERDANVFAAEQVNRNKYVIKKILGMPETIGIRDITLNW